MHEESWMGASCQASGPGPVGHAQGFLHLREGAEQASPVFSCPQLCSPGKDGHTRVAGSVSNLANVSPIVS